MNYSIHNDVKNRRVLSYTPDDSIKVCCCDCIYCPLGRTEKFVKEPLVLEKSREYKRDLRELLESEECADVDFVSFDTNGESLIYKDLDEYCDIVHEYGKRLMVETAGYGLHDPIVQKALSKCDELSIELQDTSDKMFMKLHRPSEGMFFDDLIAGYEGLRSWYKGNLKVSVFILNSQNDDSESIAFLKAILDRMEPDEVSVQTLNDTKFKAFHIEEPRAAKLIDQFSEYITP